MNLILYDFSGRHHAKNENELEIILKHRFDSSFNGYWISHNDEEAPLISLLVNNELAFIIYFPFNGHPGFVPKGTSSNLDPKEYTTFKHDSLDQEIEIPNYQVVPFETAMKVIQEFITSKNLPNSIEWTEL
jgi:hypothetical protein